MFVYLFPGKKRFSVHRLVLELFVGPCPDGMEGCHNNGDPSNNSLSNLRWDTPKANAADRRIHGVGTWGERNGAAKLTAEQVLAIRTEFARGVVGQSHLAEMYGVSEGAIALIVQRKRWTHI